MSDVPLTFGCVLYGVSITGFVLFLIACVALNYHASGYRNKRLENISPFERNAEPRNSEEVRRDRHILLWTALPALFFFVLMLCIDFGGMGWGLFGAETACPQGWPHPGTLRAYLGSAR